MMDCAELLATLHDRFDGDPADGDREALDHLAACQPCRIVVDNIRHTIRLYQRGQELDVPVDLHGRLCRLLRDFWPTRFHPCGA